MGSLILYLHGFCSSPASWKSQLLAEEMARRGMAAQFVCPQLSWAPDEAVASVSRLIEQAGGPVTLIGSSLGGHYANYLAEKHGLQAVLINPAAVDRLDLAKFVGDHANFHSGERFTFTEAHAAQLKAQVRQPTPARYWLLPKSATRCWITGRRRLFTRAVGKPCSPVVITASRSFPISFRKSLNSLGYNP
jgi:predicted esterase YcpF (UPF0227 family)